MLAKIYRVKDRYTGLKYCLSKQPVPGDYLYSGKLDADTPDKVYSWIKSLSRNQPDEKILPLKPGDIIVIDGCAYMSLKDSWVTVTFNEAEAYI